MAGERSLGDETPLEIATHEAAHAVACIEFDFAFEDVAFCGRQTRVRAIAYPWDAPTIEPAEMLQQLYVVSLVGYFTDAALELSDDRLEESRADAETEARAVTIDPKLPDLIAESEAILRSAWPIAEALVNSRLDDIKALGARLMHPAY